MLAVLLVALLGAGAFACWWRATAVDRRVNALLDEFRGEPPGLLQRWLAKLGLAEKRRTAHTDAQQGILALAGLGPDAVPELIRALRDTDPAVRRTAAVALWHLRDRRSTDPLVTALKDEHWLVRLRAAEALGRLGDPRAVGPLIAALADEHHDVREVAASALGRLGDALAVGPLEKLLADENGVVVDRAGEAIEEIRLKSSLKDDENL